MSDDFEVRFPCDCTAIERDFLDGLARIAARRPETPRLVELARSGKLAPTQTSVAIEAGHSRTLISGRVCALPRVAAEIARARAWYRGAKRPADTDQAGVEVDELKRIRRKLEQMTAARNHLRRQRDASYTSDAAAGMLAAELRKAGRMADADVRRLRRLAEQTVISDRMLPAS